MFDSASRGPGIGRNVWTGNLATVVIHTAAAATVAIGVSGVATRPANSSVSQALTVHLAPLAVRHVEPPRAQSVSSSVGARRASVAVEPARARAAAEGESRPAPATVMPAANWDLPSAQALSTSIVGTATPSVAAAAIGVPRSATPSASGSAHGTAAPAIGAASARSNWSGLVLGRLQQVKRYPARARARRLEGVSQVRFTVDRAGRVLSVELERSSGHEVLDREAVAIIDRAAPLPLPPADILGSTIELSVPIEFFLTR